MDSSRMRTARSSSCRGGLHQAPPWEQTRPGTKHPPPGADTHPRDQTPLDQAPPGPGTPPVNRITDTCKNITFPQLRLRAVIIYYEKRLKFSSCWGGNTTDGVSQKAFD